MKRGNENKPHIGIFGVCNAGKSTLLNTLLAEPAAIVSEQCGTTTDPVKRAMEILNFAPVVLIDTAGIDDKTVLGEERKNKTLETLFQVDLAILVYRDTWGEWENYMIERIHGQFIPYIIINNTSESIPYNIDKNRVHVNLLNENSDARDAILDLIKHELPEYSYVIPSLFGSSIVENNIVVLVCPIDSEAPAGRMILPQVQAIRDLLDKNAIVIAIQPQQLSSVLNSFNGVKMVVTDSQVIDVVKEIVAEKIEVTTFSILLAAMKGNMALYQQGLKKVDDLRDGDRVLILESCTHQVSCEDIGRVKIPMWLQKYTKKRLEFDFVTKLSALPHDLSQYAFAVQCGGCMVTRRQILGRINRVAKQGVAITNYGMLISKIK